MSGLRYEFKLLILRFVFGHNVVNGSPRCGNIHETFVSLKVITTWHHVCHDVAMTDVLKLNFRLMALFKGSDG